MELVLVERERSRDHSVDPKGSVSRKGTIYINTKAMAILKVPKEGINVFFFQDSHEKQKWFLKPSEKGYVKLKPKDPKKDGSGQIYIKDVANKIIDSFYHEGDKSLKFKIKDHITYQGELYYPLEVDKKSIKMNIPDPNGA